MRKLSFKNKLIIIGVSTSLAYLALYLMSNVCVNLVPQYESYQVIPYLLLILAAIHNGIKIIKDKHEVTA